MLAAFSLISVTALIFTNAIGQVSSVNVKVALSALQGDVKVSLSAQDLPTYSLSDALDQTRDVVEGYRSSTAADKENISNIERVGVGLRSNQAWLDEYQKEVEMITRRDDSLTL